MQARGFGCGDMKASSREKRKVCLPSTPVWRRIFYWRSSNRRRHFGHSPALLADGINSTSDVAYYLVIFIFMRLRAQTGRCRASLWTLPDGYNCGLVVGAFVVTTAIAIFWEAMNDVYDLAIGEKTLAAPLLCPMGGPFHRGSQDRALYLDPQDWNPKPELGGPGPGL